jgi:hypothetical protein
MTPPALEHRGGSHRRCAGGELDNVLRDPDRQLGFRVHRTRPEPRRAALAPTHLLRVQCRPDKVQSVARTLASWPQTVFVYALAESAEVIAELTADFDALPALLGAELDGVLTYG